MLLGAVCALGALAGCWLNGASQAVCFLLTGLTGLGLLLLPPRSRLPWPPLAAGGLLLAVAAAGLLPASWAGREPAWRTHLTTDWELPLPATLSPQPALTQGALLTLAAGLGWFCLLLGQRFSERARRWIMTVTALGIVALAVVALAQHFGWVTTGWPHGGGPPSGFHLGPFRNRNHFSGLCAIGCVLCAGLTVNAFSRRSPFWPLFAVALLAPFAAIAVNTSRGGLLLFFAGMVGWLFVAAARGGHMLRLVGVLAFCLCAATSLVLYGGGATARLAADTQDASEISLGLRGDIYKQAVPLILRRFWSGNGLGNFEAVFGMEHRLDLPHNLLLHPESDWLWLGYEAGLPAMLALGAGLIWLVRAAGPWLSRRRGSRRHDRLLRLTAAIGALMALVNGLFDVPLHNYAFASLILLLAACAVPQRRLETDASRLYQFGFRLAGLAALALCLGHARGLRGQPVLPGKFQVETLAAQALEHFQNGRLQQARTLLDQALAQAPLRWDLYYRRALTRLALREPAETALQDFGRARALKRGNQMLRWEEGRLWLDHRPELAIVPWGELLRAPKLEPNYGYEAMLSLARPHPALRASLLALAATPAQKAVRLLAAENAEDWGKALADLLASEPDWSHLEPGLRARVLTAWLQRGDKAALLEWLEANPRWQADIWRPLAEEHARQSEFEQAWELLRRHADLPAAPAFSGAGLPLSQLERHFVYHPNDLKHGIDLYFAQKQRGMDSEAGRTLEKLLALPGAPPWLVREKAETLAARKEFRQAYELLKNHLKPRN